MSDLNFRFTSIGPLGEAQVKIEGFTVITGENNTGKSYLAHSIYGLLRHVTTARRLPLSGRVPHPAEMDALTTLPVIEQLDRHGVANLDLSLLSRLTNELLEQISTEFSQRIGTVFATGDEAFGTARVSLQVSDIDFTLLNGFNGTLSIGRSNPVASVRFLQSTTSLCFESLEGFAESDPSSIENWVRRTVARALLRASVPGVLISSAERTGAVIFQRELDFARSKLLEEVLDSSESSDGLSILREGAVEHPDAVTANVDFIRRLPDIQSTPSEIIRENPEIAALLRKIVGGEYQADDHSLTFVSDTVQLPLGASSSAIRSLVDLWFYIMHVVKAGDILIIDEPELNLHPRNQRLLARLLVMVHNAGVKILITTHSDYIVRELSSLVVFREIRHAIPADVEATLEEQGIHASMGLNRDSLHVYSTSAPTTATPVALTEIEVNESGIEPTTFDDVISSQNELYDMVRWGADVQAGS